MTFLAECITLTTNKSFTSLYGVQIYIYVYMCCYSCVCAYVYIYQTSKCLEAQYLFLSVDFCHSLAVELNFRFVTTIICKVQEKLANFHLSSIFFEESFLCKSGSGALSTLCMIAKSVNPAYFSFHINIIQTPYEFKLCITVSNSVNKDEF